MMSRRQANSRDIRQQANRKSLVHALAFLADDFRDRIRQSLHQRGHRLQSAHTKVLVHLDMEGTRLTDLAQRAGISKQAMGKLVDEMESLGYVCRDPHSDGRAKTIQFTQDGLRLLQDSSAIVDESWQYYAQHFGAQRLEKFRDELNELYTVIRKNKGDRP
jgi:DNA-binding MarR family transcriptional regulator